MWNELDIDRLWQATGETFYMVGISTIFTALLGIPLGILLVVTDRNHIWEKEWLFRILDITVNILRGMPFVVLILFLFPLSKLLLGTSIGSTGAIMPLVVGAAPFYARLVETAIREIDWGVIEAAQAMGANRFEIIRKVLIPEAMPALVSGLTVTCVSLISYSTMAGFVGGGGLGDTAFNYGFLAFNDQMLYACGILLVVIVQLVQVTGDWISKRLDKR